VVPYFERFIARFPDVQSLADADPDQVLRLWEGLGYYSRARNLHRTARQIVSEQQGEFPQSTEDLQQLPGIGPYTAGAISSFAFNLPAPIVEANTLRLYSRLICLEADPRSSAGQKVLWKFAAWIVSRRRAADFNQAVMDIGAQVCTPQKPDCPRCPLMPSCKAFEAGKHQILPLEPVRPVMTHVVEMSIAICKQGRFLLRQRPPGERWAGLWDFVRFEISDELANRMHGPPAKPQTRKRPVPQQRSLFDADQVSFPQFALADAVANTVQQLTGTVVNHYQPIAEIHHTVTRYRIRLLCVKCEIISGRLRQDSGFQWFTVEQMQNLPLSKTGRQLADQLS
jgi:A/G-specific adenine glycosylase